MRYRVNMTKAKLVESKIGSVQVGQTLMTKMTLTVEAILVPTGPDYEELVRVVTGQELWIGVTLR
jgi:hypothetical protein